jgi:hypothetical protein
MYVRVTNRARKVLQLGRVGIAPQTEEEWSDWVQMMIRQVLAIRELEFEAINVVSFIDS